MSKYYLEVESFKDDGSIIGVRVIGQCTKNRREKFAKALENVKFDFFRIHSKTSARLSLCQDLGVASKLLKSIASRHLRANAIRRDARLNNKRVA